ncbi:MAG: hypothetical protein ACRCZ9_02360 [Fusobacteriaceae bacterium]
MCFKVKNNGDIFLASICDYKDINSILSHWNKACSQIKYNKHSGEGTVIRRRNTQKERTHGKVKSIISAINNIRDLATTLRHGLSDFGFDIKNPPIETKLEALSILKAIDNTTEKKIHDKYKRILSKGDPQIYGN